MKKSNYFKVIGAVAVSTVVSLAYAGFTEINSSGDIVSKDSANALRTSFQHQIKIYQRHYAHIHYGIRSQRQPNIMAQ